MILAVRAGDVRITILRLLLILLEMDNKQTLASSLIAVWVAHWMSKRLTFATPRPILLGELTGCRVVVLLFWMDPPWFLRKPVHCLLLLNDMLVTLGELPNVFHDMALLIAQNVG